MICRNCQQPFLRRRKRRGFLQRFVYSLFGYYPWRCTLCNTGGMYRGRLDAETERRQVRANDLGEA